MVALCEMGCNADSIVISWICADNWSKCIDWKASSSVIKPCNICQLPDSGTKFFEFPHEGSHLRRR